jgi:hypothetical protein
MNVVTNTPSVYKNLYKQFYIEGTAGNFDLKKMMLDSKLTV